MWLSKQLIFLMCCNIYFAMPDRAALAETKWDTVVHNNKK